MKAWLINYWDDFRGSYWFLPSLMATATVALSFIGPEIDRELDLAKSKHFQWLATSAVAARTTLSSLAAAMVTATSVVFSITIVALSMTTSQFGSRLLRNFMLDTVTQVALGALLSTSLYCLLLLRTVYALEGDPFVPHLSIMLAMVMMVASLGMLIWFVHHTSVAIQAQTVVKGVAEELDDAIKRLFPEEIGVGADDIDASESAIERRLEDLGRWSDPIAVTHEGYVEGVDGEGLLNMAVEQDAVIELLLRPGDFVVRGQPLARVWRHAETAAPDDEDRQRLAERLNATCILGRRRTPRQDVECAVDELVEVAVRALSPGINDPFTAMACADRLGASLSRLAQRRIPSPFRHDADHQLRVIARPYTFESVLNAAFDQIRQYGRSSASVTIRLLESLIVIASVARRPDDCAAIRRQAEMLRDGAEQALPEPRDRQDVGQRFDRVLTALAHPAEAGKLPMAARASPVHSR
ncbi:MAG: DUF2254 domain-containing protein [Planctomycetes bacterium]|nr:DUF2254 domain-containing protein [Planctomycetota bacterium]